MEGFDKIQYNRKTPAASVNEALLDEFFSIIAGVAIRLINDKPSLEKNLNKAKPKGERSC